MSFPLLAPPVRRPELVRPEELSVVREAIERAGGDQRRFEQMYTKLSLGFNFNDPQAFAFPGYERMKVS